MLVDAELDVLALQEVQFESDGNSSLLREISTRTKLKYVSGFPLSQSIFYPGYRSGIAVATRAPHCVKARIDLPNPNLSINRDRQRWTSWDKGLIITKIDFEGMPMWVSSVHCYPFHEFVRQADEKEFTPIWQALANSINGLPNARMIVAGDFNTERRDLLTRLLNHYCLVRAIDGIATHGTQSVDDILHDINLIRRNSKVVPTFSDHAFCLAELTARDD